MWKLSESSLRNREGIDQRLIYMSDRALVLSPIDFGIPTYGGLRTYDEQVHLFDLGVSEYDGKSRRSKHQYGLAIDFFAYVDGRSSWDKNHMTTVACAFLQAASERKFAVEWGGHWVKLDMPHIELFI